MSASKPKFVSCPTVPVAITICRSFTFGNSPVRGARDFFGSMNKQMASLLVHLQRKAAFSPKPPFVSRTGGKVDGETIEARIKRDFEIQWFLFTRRSDIALVKEKEWAAFCLFAASMMVRVPNYIANTQPCSRKSFNGASTL